jgi:hypothetical protein
MFLVWEPVELSVSYALASRFTITEGVVVAIVRPVSPCLRVNKRKRVALMPNSTLKEFNIREVAEEHSLPWVRTSSYSMCLRSVGGKPESSCLAAWAQNDGSHFTVGSGA